MSDAEIIERYLLYMRYAVMNIEIGWYELARDALCQTRILKDDNPHITFPRVKLDLKVIK